MPTPKVHRWEYAELAPIPPTEGPRPAQRCARCGMVRRRGTDDQGSGWWLYYETQPDQNMWLRPGTEPPCTPQEAPAKPNVGP